MFNRPKYFSRIEPFINKPIIKVLSGQRRVGKSYLLLLIQKYLSESSEHNYRFIFINKEKDKFRDINNAAQLSSHISEQSHTTGNLKNVVFIDEVQEIAEFEKSVRSFASKPDYELYLTGSNSEMLSGELATRLSGRYVEIPVYSLDFKEFCLFHNLQQNDEALSSYMKYGGLPFLTHLPLQDDVIFEYLDNIIATIIYKDVISRYQIRNISFLNSLLRFAADNIGNLLSANKISAYLKSQKINITVNTVLDYLTFLENSQIIHVVKRFDIRGKKIFEIGEKYYFQDIGIRNAITGYKISDIGKIMENIVYHHLISNRYTVFVGYDQQREIDFVAQKENETIYIQVAYLLTQEATIQREFGNLLEIKDNYRKLVVSMDPQTKNTEQGIEHWNLLNFLREFE